jgi:hypothetical protein
VFLFAAFFFAIGAGCHPPPGVGCFFFKSFQCFVIIGSCSRLNIVCRLCLSAIVSYPCSKSSTDVMVASEHSSVRGPEVPRGLCVYTKQSFHPQELTIQQSATLQTRVTLVARTIHMVVVLLKGFGTAAMNKGSVHETTTHCLLHSDSGVLMDAGTTKLSSSMQNNKN